MPALKCFKCNKMIAGDLDSLSGHFRFVHGLALSAGHDNMGFICAQDGCLASFVYWKNLRRHIKTYHLPNSNNGDPGNQNENEAIGLIGGGEIEMGHDHMDVSNADDSNHGEDENIMPAVPNLRSSVLRMMCNLRSNSSVTTTVLTDCLSEASAVFTDTVTYVKSKVDEFVRSKNLDEDNDAKALLKDLDIPNPYLNLDTIEKQIDALKEHFNYLEPKEVYLGSRLELRQNKKTGLFQHVQVKESFQYVPLIKILELVLMNPEAREVIINESASDDSNTLSSVMDGSFYKNHPFFSVHRHALRLVIYYDEFEVVNPLGANTAVHKMGAFYFFIDNFPPHVKSSLSNIHVLLLFHDEDRKKYGFEKLLDPFLQDLKKLESNEGVQVDLGSGTDFIIRAAIAAFVGDGLAIHQVYNLLGPSARLFCRMCLISRQDLHLGRFGPGEARSREVYEAHLALLRENPNDRNVCTETGVQGECALHLSTYFHLSSNKTFDPMHDFLEGICPYELKLVLHKYICEDRLFSVEFFNGRISFFKYGKLESKNKPKANFTLQMIRNTNDHCLKQSAANLWLLIRSFPFLVKDKIPPGDKHMELILYLLRIMEIVFAPKLRREILPYLSRLVYEHNLLFQDLFPEQNFINKHHHITHYAECAEFYGPLIALWCMRFEGKHQTLKKMAHIMCNFKNPPLTLIRVAQGVQCATWGEGTFKINSFSSRNGKLVTLEATKSAAHAVAKLGCGETDLVFIADSIRVNGAHYELDLFVCLKNGRCCDDGLPLFGKVNEIICVNSVPFLFVEVYLTEMFDTSVNSYLISKNRIGEEILVGVSELASYNSLSLWGVPSGTQTYICLRHILV